MTEVEKIADQLVNLTVKDVNNLTEILKEKYGIKPNILSNSINNNSSLEKNDIKQDEKNIFDVILKSSGNTKLKVIKAIKDIFGKSLTESKSLVDAAPKSVLKQGVNKEEAEKLKKQLEEHGAEVELI